MAADRNAREVIPSPPITKGLVGTGPLLLKALEALTSADQASAARTLRRLAKDVERAQRDAELITQMIEKRLRAVESAAMDQQNSLGNIIGLSDEDPLPVATSADPGTGTKASRWDHVHAGAQASGGGLTTQLPLVGPNASISGTDWLGITQEVPLPPRTWADMILIFPWQAGGFPVDAEWRLQNRKTSTTIATGSRQGGFAPLVESSTIAASAFPTSECRLCLEFRFGGATGDQVGLWGPAVLAEV